MFYFTPLPGSFSPFPHGTASLSVTKQYLALRDGPRSFIRDSTCLALLWILPCQLCFRILDFHYLWSTFPNNSANFVESIMQSKPLPYYYDRFRLFLFRSPLLKESISFFLFLRVLRCFSSPRSLLIHYFTHVWILELFYSSEFPHSDISGSLDICSSPKLFAAYHVLLRLLVPRYSPYALCSLTYLSWLFFCHC